MLGTAELETIILDNNSETLAMGLSDFADLILHWRAHGCHVHPCTAVLASPADAEHP
jgi:hypothetical protein